MEHHLSQTKKLSAKKIHLNIEDHLKEISKEFRTGFTALEKYPKSVSIFGSSRATPLSPHYRNAQELAYRIVKELGYSIITGGGPGIMSAANLGAQEAGGESIGFNIDLPHEQHVNPYTSSSVHFKYFFARKTMLTFAAEAYVCFPGGFGTFDELFSILTLIQTKKIPEVPVILVDEKFWSPLREFMISSMLEKYHAINKHDLDRFTITDDMAKVIQIIKKAPISNWWESED